MNAPAIILATGFIFLSLFSYSQTKYHSIKVQKQVLSPVTKGYYAIGNNAQKLTAGVNVQSNETANMILPFVRKGYFAIGSNRKKLERQGIEIQTNNTRSSGAARPVIRKGYYAIGNNAEKLP